ncbi:MAG TPA: YdeI/OmpD-associated family protein [Vicinamibacterales bacterium]|nr:YdeI/OmpD-associated family protein [Vicinamibacterales bacterium]
MGTRDPRVDAYIAAAPDFARPILTRFRDAVHAGCPDVVETVKWGSPTFERKKIICGMAAFKAHCRVGFWNLSQVARGRVGLSGAGITAWFPSVSAIGDLPPKATLVRLVKEAAALDAQGVRAPHPRRARTPAAPLTVPDDLLEALRQNRKALTTFEAFAPSHRKEYIQWVTEAKREATRAARIAAAVDWIAEGKPRNWKYMPARRS